MPRVKKLSGNMLDHFSIDLMSSDLDDAKNFAYQRVLLSADHYKKRGQEDLDKIQEDIITGALGERAICDLLRFFKQVPPPDFQVYAPGEKSWAADFTDEDGNKYHCKSQTIASAKKYGHSYILQFDGEGSGHKDPLFDLHNPFWGLKCTDFFIPCCVDVDNLSVDIFGVIPVDLLFSESNHLIKLPKATALQETKRAIYLKDILKLSFLQRWGVLFNKRK